jgi:hypothetical protein
MELRDLFIQRHARQQIGDAFVDGQARIEEPGLGQRRIARARGTVDAMQTRVNRSIQATHQARHARRLTLLSFGPKKERTMSLPDISATDAGRQGAEPRRLQRQGGAGRETWRRSAGSTPQYAGLEALWREFKDKGLAVLGFPSNDFGSQEPGSEAQIREFCTKNYGRDVSDVFEESRRPVTDSHRCSAILSADTASQMELPQVPGQQEGARHQGVPDQHGPGRSQAARGDRGRARRRDGAGLGYAGDLSGDERQDEVAEYAVGALERHDEHALPAGSAARRLPPRIARGQRP